MTGEMTAKEYKERKAGTEELALEPAESLPFLRSFAANPDLGFKVFKLAESLESRAGEASEEEKSG